MKATPYILLIISFFGIQPGLSNTIDGIVQGHVIDKAIGKSLENANVIILNTKFGAATDHNGFFKLKIPANQYEIEVRMMGYKRVRQQCIVTPNQEVVLNFYLEPEVYQFQPVDVVAEKFASQTEISLLPIRLPELKKVPALAEPDVLRAVTILPGVTSINDFSSQFFVRGGNFDQTMILFDGAPVYNPYHLGGIFSMFYAEALGDVVLHAGGYPAQEDGYLSGKLNIHTKEYNGVKKASLSIASAGFVFENRLWKGTCLVSFRRTYFDLFSLMVGQKLPYYFYDVIGKYAIDVNSNNKMNISAFYSKDMLGTLPDKELEKPDAESPNWGNKVLSIQWNSLLNSNMYLESHITYSESFNSANTVNNIVTNRISDFTFSENLYYNWGKQNLSCGFSIKKLQFCYDWDIHYSELSDLIHPVADAFFDYAPASFNFRKDCFQSGYYLQNEINITKKMSTTVGLRLNHFSLNKETNLAPRLNICYELNPTTKLKWTYGRFYQYLYTLKERKSQSIFTPFTAIFPIDSNQNIQPANSDHYIAGIEIKNFFWNWDLLLEGYYKKYHNLITSLDEIPRYRHENGYALGCDLLLKKSEGKFKGWLSYSYGVSKKENQHQDYFTSYDRPHSIKFLGYFQLTQKWKLNLFWVYSSGTPYTPIIGKFKGGWDWREELGDPTVVIGDDQNSLIDRRLFGEKNSLRFPAYHRFDIGISRNYYVKNHILSLNFQILNVYNNDNPYYYDYEVSYFNSRPKQSKGLPILPTIAFEIEM